MTWTSGRSARRVSLVRAVLLTASSCASAQVLAAQSSPAAPAETRLDLGAGALAFISYPEALVGPTYFDVRAVGFQGSMTYWPFAVVGLEAGVTSVTTSGGVTEALALRPAPLPGEPYRRVVTDEDLEGPNLFATSIGAVVEPALTPDVSPRGRVGVSRLWNKKLNAWLYALGVRYRFGRHSVLFEVERWHLSVEQREETRVLRTDGQVDLLDVDIVSIAERPLHVRVGWAIELGR